MSFILDALKKSEAERQRPQAPTLLDLPAGQRQRSMPLWLLAVLALLLVNLTVLLMLWRRPSPSPTPGVANDAVSTVATTSTAATGNSATNTQTNMAPRMISGNVRSLQDEAAGPELDEALSTNIEASTPAREPLVTRLDEARVNNTPLAVGSPVASSKPARVTTSSSVPTLDSLGGSSAFNLPALTLNLHVYSTQPNQRFMFINGKKYSEGQQLSEGPQLETITEDGAVLTYQGKRFSLSR